MTARHPAERGAASARAMVGTDGSRRRTTWAVAALRLAGAVGLHALSAAYIGLVWTFALLRPVREAGAARTGWSVGTRPRLFENG